MIRHSRSFKINNWLNGALILLLAVFCLFSGRSTSAQQVKVMQWNVEGNDGQGLGRLSNNTNAQTKANARIVNYNQPDILLFNEIDANNQTAAVGEAALIDWITNNVPYLGTQLGVTFYVKASSGTDGFIRNAAVSRFPIFAEGTYASSKMVRGLHAFRVQLEGTNVLQIFHAHLKCCDLQSDCDERQTNAIFASSTIRAWAATNSTPYIVAGDWNEDELNPQCAPGLAYRPITMMRTNSNVVEFAPTTLNGSSKTISTPSPTRRFDYCLAASNRLSAVAGYVFNSSVWAQNGLYTNANPQNLASDSTTASDHCSVFVTYSFPASITNFSVTPTNAFTSSGNEGGSFSPSSQTYTLTNSDTIPLFWSVTKTSNWLTISTLATNLTLGAGATTNITAFITNSVANSLTGGTYVDMINFSNTATGVSFSRDVTLTVSFTPPLASFTGSPTTGTDSLAVTFVDTSTGSITNRFWDFGDSSTTNVTTNSVAHAYSNGTYTVTLITSGPLGSSTNTRPNYITVLSSPLTILADAGNLFGSTTNNLAPTNSVAVLVADTGNNGFTEPQASFPLGLGATWGTDDKVIGLWDLSACNCGDGELYDQTVVAYTNGIAPGQKLQLYWFPSLTLASNTLGVTSYGKYTDTNSPPLNGSDAWQMPAGGTNVYLKFYTTFWGGSNPETAGLATLLTAGGLTPFESWQIQYFGDTNNPAAAESADPDGDGQNNLAEFLAGTDPTNNAAVFRIVSATAEGSNIRLIWTTGSGRTNALQLSTGGVSGNYSNNFADIFTITNTVGSVTNYLDVGAATNAPVRYYRVRLVP
jgi:PKD repeat protein/endonuclease/exonuclease/phosphatase family metal-dependent hydrolase